MTMFSDQVMARCLYDKTLEIKSQLMEISIMTQISCILLNKHYALVMVTFHLSVSVNFLLISLQITFSVCSPTQSAAELIRNIQTVMKQSPLFFVSWSEQPFIS